MDDLYDPEHIQEREKMRYLIIFSLLLALFLSGCGVRETIITPPTPVDSSPKETMEQNIVEERMNENNTDILLEETPIERNTEPTTLKELKVVEIRQYEGKRLDSMEDIRDLSIKGPQYIDSGDYRLEIVGLVDNPKEYTYEEVLEHQKYTKVITLYCVTGWDATVLWEGVLLKDLFDEVKVRPEANTVIFYAEDGYTTSLPLDYIISNYIMLADKVNNVTLVPERGFPFELVAENKLGYKWIKWVTKIELSDDESYEGYWESRGYSNKADI